MKTAIYARVTTRGQTGHLPKQIEEIELYAKTKGYELTKIYKDVGSKDIEERDGINAAKKDAHEFSKLIARELDRFGNTSIIENLSKYFSDRGVGLVCIEENVDSMEDWQGFMRELEDAKINERDINRKKATQKDRQLKIAKTIAGRRGIRGKPPFGYWWKSIAGKKRFTWNENIQVVIDIFMMFLYQHSSLKAIKEELERQGKKSPKGKDSWSDGTVRQILKNPVYKGITKNGLKCPPKIDEWTWDRVQKRLPMRANTHFRYVLSKLAWCKKCGVRILARESKYYCSICKQEWEKKALEEEAWKGVKKQIKEELGWMLNDTGLMAILGNLIMERIGDINANSLREKARITRNWLPMELGYKIKVGEEGVEVRGLQGADLRKTLDRGKEWSIYFEKETEDKRDTTMLRKMVENDMQKLDKISRKRAELRKKTNVYNDEDYIDFLVEEEEFDDL